MDALQYVEWGKLLCMFDVCQSQNGVILKYGQWFLKLEILFVFKISLSKQTLRANRIYFAQKDYIR